MSTRPRAHNRSDIMNRPGVVAHIAGISNPSSARMAILPRSASNNKKSQTQLLKDYLNWKQETKPIKSPKALPTAPSRSQPLPKQLNDHQFTVVNRSKKTKKGSTVGGPINPSIIQVNNNKKKKSVAPITSHNKFAFVNRSKALVSLNPALRTTSCQKSLLSSFALPTKTMILYLGCIATNKEKEMLESGVKFTVVNERINFNINQRNHLQGASIHHHIAQKFTKKALAEYRANDKIIRKVYMNKIILEIHINLNDKIYLFDVNYKGNANLSPQSLECLMTMGVTKINSTNLVNSKSSIIKRVTVARDKLNHRKPNGSLKYRDVTPQTIVKWSKSQGEVILYAPIFSNQIKPSMPDNEDNHKIIVEGVRSSTIPLNEAISHIRTATEYRQKNRKGRDKGGKGEGWNPSMWNPSIVSNSNRLGLHLIYSGFKSPYKQGYSVGLHRMNWEDRKKARMQALSHFVEKARKSIKSKANVDRKNQTTRQDTTNKIPTISPLVVPSNEQDAKKNDKTKSKKSNRKNQTTRQDTTNKIPTISPLVVASNEQDAKKKDKTKSKKSKQKHRRP